MYSKYDAKMVTENAGFLHQDKEATVVATGVPREAREEELTQY